MKIIFSSCACLLLIIHLVSGCSKQPDPVAADCLIDEGSCLKKIASGDIAVVFDISPKPVRTMSGLVFSVSLHRVDKAVTDADVSLNLTMPGMYMGENSVIMRHTGGGTYEGSGVLVRCPSGKKKWKAEIVIKNIANNPDADLKTDYIFEVRK